MQLVNGDKYSLRAETNRLREVPILPTRGLIYDRNGVPLVENRASFAAAVVAADVPEERETEISDRAAGASPACRPATSQTAIDAAPRVQRPVHAGRDQGQPQQRDGLRAAREAGRRCPACASSSSRSREYTAGAADVAHPRLRRPRRRGRVRRARRLRLPAQRPHRQGRRRAHLRVVLRGIARQCATSRPTPPAARSASSTRSRRSAGNNVVLSIDLDLQRKVEEILRAAMGKSQERRRHRHRRPHRRDPGPGLAAHLRQQHLHRQVDERGAANACSTDPAKPMLNHAIAEMYPPGCTFKQITGLAALQEGVATANTLITSPGVHHVAERVQPRAIRYPFRDWRATSAR